MDGVGWGDGTCSGGRWLVGSLRQCRVVGALLRAGVPLELEEADRHTGAGELDCWIVLVYEVHTVRSRVQTAVPGG